MMRRQAFTLIEVLLAVALTTLLLAALYFTLTLYMDGMQAGRNNIDQAAVVRALFNRMKDDISSSLTLVDPARFRNWAEAMEQAEAAGGGAPMSGAAAGAAAGAAGAASGGTGAGGDANEEAGDPEAMGATITNLIPLGVMGSANELHLYVTKVPADALRGALASDIRKISYWMGPTTGGLCRVEHGVILSQEGLMPIAPLEDDSLFLVAPEVIGAQFRYFDGAGWFEAWDSSEIGPDQVTPIGPPRAIEIVLLVQQPSARNALVPREPKMYRHVVVIPTANGPAMNVGGGMLP
jgi:prepilin-type N-terminal cleavage/methylation domain-containing protein